MKRAFERAFARWGAEVTVERGDERVTTRAFIQPLDAQQGGVPFSVGPLGAVDTRRWRYLGAEAVPAGARVCWGERCFAVRRSDTVYLGGTALYHRAVLQEVCA